MKTFITLMNKTITQENTLSRARLEFVSVIRAKIRPTRTPKSFEK